MSCLLIAAAVVLFAFTHAADARNYEVKKKISDHDVFIQIDKNPPVTGNNNMTIEIKNKGGKYVTDAQVTVNYWMPPMPGMPPMNFRTNATPNGNLYRAKMDIIMTGPWNIDVKIRTNTIFSVKFNVDAR